MQTQRVFYLQVHQVTTFHATYNPYHAVHSLNVTFSGGILNLRVKIQNLRNSACVFLMHTVIKTEENKNNKLAKNIK